MNLYIVDFYPKAAHAKKNLSALSARDVAEDDAGAKKLGRREIHSENPELNLTEFEIEVSELLHR